MPKRGHRQRDEEGSQNCERVRNPERREEPSCKSRQRDYGKYDEDDREGGVDNGAANLETGIENHAGNSMRFRKMFVLPQPPEDVLDTDDGIVDNHADGDGKPAQGRVSRAPSEYDGAQLYER